MEPLILKSNRNTHLEGWRAIAIIGIMWHHWTPASWRFGLPFEIGLFFFLTLTGFLITQTLLKELHSAHPPMGRWKLKSYAIFLKRRFARIFVPCYVAMLLAIILGANDIQQHPWVYFFHLSNFHIAYLDNWPSGTAHFWTLAIQIQFYLIWPILLFYLPRRVFIALLWALIISSPVIRYTLSDYLPAIRDPSAITFGALDYFAFGSLLALAFQAGMAAGNRNLARVSLISIVLYSIIYLLDSLAVPFWHGSVFQQTFLSIAFLGLISHSLTQQSSWVSQILEHPRIQAIAKISYGLFLYHNLAPLFVGMICPFLWNPWFSGDGPILILRIIGFSITTWLLASLSWRWIESSPKMKLQPLGNQSQTTQRQD